MAGRAIARDNSAREQRSRQRLRVAALAAPVLRHRLLLSFTAEAEGRSADDVVVALLRGLPFPGA